MIRPSSFLAILLFAAPAWAQVYPTFNGDRVNWEAFDQANQFFRALRTDGARETPEPNPRALKFRIAQAKKAYPEQHHRWYVSKWEAAFQEINERIEKFEAAQERRAAAGGTYSLAAMAAIRRANARRQQYKMEIDTYRWALLRNDPVYIPRMRHEEFAAGRVGRVLRTFEVREVLGPSSCVVRGGKEFAGPPILIDGLSTKELAAGETLRLEGPRVRLEAFQYQGEAGFKFLFLDEGEEPFPPEHAPESPVDGGEAPQSAYR